MALPANRVLPAHVEVVTFRYLLCARRGGANLPGGHGYSTATLPLKHRGAPPGTSSMEAAGLLVILAWLHLQLALEILSLQHDWVSSTLTHEHEHFFNPAPSFLLLHKILAASISNLYTMGAITNQAVMFSIAYLTLYVWRVIARAFIFNSAA